MGVQIDEARGRRSSPRHRLPSRLRELRSSGFRDEAILYPDIAAKAWQRVPSTTIPSLITVSNSGIRFLPGALVSDVGE